MAVQVADSVPAIRYGANIDQRFRRWRESGKILARRLRTTPAVTCRCNRNVILRCSRSGQAAVSGSPPIGRTAAIRGGTARSMIVTGPAGADQNGVKLMHLKYFLAASAASVSLACSLAAPAMAQETSSAVRGVVQADGAPVAGATVVIVHEPSGTTQSVNTDATGSFAANGLRIGGPFTVTVDAPGYESTTVSDLFLQAGQPARLPIALQAQKEIVVTAAAIRWSPSTLPTAGPSKSPATTAVSTASRLMACRCRTTSA